MPGYIMSLMNEAAYNGWVQMFHLNFVAGVPMTMFVHWVICKFSPPPGAGLGTTFHDDSIPFGLSDGVYHGVEPAETVYEKSKGAETSVKDRGSSGADGIASV
jgi:nucleobase:cation symporter-1, NCS1 family